MRGFLRSAGVIVVLSAVAGVAAANDFFPQSVASGDPTPTSVVLWTRAIDGDGGIPTRVILSVATDEAFTNVVVKRPVDVDSQYDGVVKIKVDGLTPYTDYYYQFAVGENLSPIGRTRTAPTPDMDVPVRFAVVYCQDYIGRYYNAYLKMLLDHDEAAPQRHVARRDQEQPPGRCAVPSRPANLLVVRLDRPGRGEVDEN